MTCCPMCQWCGIVNIYPSIHPSSNSPFFHYNKYIYFCVWPIFLSRLDWLKLVLFSLSPPDGRICRSSGEKREGAGGWNFKDKVRSKTHTHRSLTGSTAPYLECSNNTNDKCFISDEEKWVKCNQPCCLVKYISKHLANTMNAHNRH